MHFLFLLIPNNSQISLRVCFLFIWTTHRLLCKLFPFLSEQFTDFSASCSPSYLNNSETSLQVVSLLIWTTYRLLCKLTSVYLNNSQTSLQVVSLLIWTIHRLLCKLFPFLSEQLTDFSASWLGLDHQLCRVEQRVAARRETRLEPLSLHAGVLKEAWESSQRYWNIPANVATNSPAFQFKFSLCWRRKWIGRNFNNRTDIGGIRFYASRFHTATGWTIGVLGFDSRQRREFFSSPPCPERLWGPRSLLSEGYEGLLPQG